MGKVLGALMLYQQKEGLKQKKCLKSVEKASQI
jgi:hypothetical protein